MSCGSPLARVLICGVASTALSLLGCQAGTSETETQQARERPNVLFIAVDDLNDWIEPLGGHPQARTPALDRLATQAVNFTRNYSTSPDCLPSRTSVLTGLHTYRSGVYSNYQYWREVLPDAQTLPTILHRARLLGGGRRQDIPQ
jgi:arylsulfatase A-like enzyme